MDWSFSFRCSPPRIAATQLRFDTARFFTAQERTLTVLSSCLLRRTRAGASRPAEKTGPISAAPCVLHKSAEVPAFFPGGRMPPSTAGQRPAATGQCQIAPTRSGRRDCGDFDETSARLRRAQSSRTAAAPTMVTSRRKTRRSRPPVGPWPAPSRGVAGVLKAQLHPMKTG